jgi:hypothetical protein
LEYFDTAYPWLLAGRAEAEQEDDVTCLFDCKILPGLAAKDKLIQWLSCVDARRECSFADVEFKRFAHFKKNLTRCQPATNQRVQNPP